MRLRKSKKNWDSLTLVNKVECLRREKICECNECKVTDILDMYIDKMREMDDAIKRIEKLCKKRTGAIEKIGRI